MRSLVLLFVLVAGCFATPEPNPAPAPASTGGTGTGSGNGSGGYSNSPPQQASDHQVLNPLAVTIGAGCAAPYVGCTWWYSFAVPYGYSAEVSYQVTSTSDALTACVVPQQELPNLTNGSFKCYALRTGNGGTLSDTSPALSGSVAVAVICGNSFYNCTPIVRVTANY